MPEDCEWREESFASGSLRAVGRGLLGARCPNREAPREQEWLGKLCENVSSMCLLICEIVCSYFCSSSNLSNMLSNIFLASFSDLEKSCSYWFLLCGYHDFRGATAISSRLSKEECPALLCHPKGNDEEPSHRRANEGRLDIISLCSGQSFVIRAACILSESENNL